MQNKNENLGKGEKLAFIGGLAMIALVIISTFALPAIKKNSSAENPDATSAEIEKKDSIQKISPKELQNLMLSSSAPLVVDIRSTEEYYTEHILDSVRIPYEEFSDSEQIRGAESLVLVANNGSDELLGKAQARLNEESAVKKIFQLSGGLMAWKNSGLPLVTYGDPTSFSDQAKVRYLTAEQLQKALKDEPSSVFILDLRSAESFAAQHPEGAQNIPLEELERRRLEIPSDKAVVMVADNELFEFQAAVQLYDMRMISAYVLKGALAALEAK